MPVTIMPMSRWSLSKRCAAVVIALAIAAPAAVAAAGSSSPNVVRATIDRTGSVNVSNYDGGVALAPANTP